mmetsp:Transcript_20080/g.30781  ORF Transcript_20080/g.30781 Transcript_20080/m.30781 type:complete len:155 (+) Transcript_20080:227-691(+)
MPSSFNERIPHLPIHIICMRHNIIEAPNLVRSPWSDQITPRQRWKLLNLVESVLLNSVPQAYRNEHRNELLEVAYFVERNMFATATSRQEYGSLVRFPRRVCANLWAYARCVVDQPVEREIIDALCKRFVLGGDADGGLARRCQRRCLQGAGAA